MLVNGEQLELISGADRGLAYGDGVFETIRIHKGKLVLLDEHLARLGRGLDALNISLDISLLDTDIAKILETAPANAILKILVSRGIQQGRGYRPANKDVQQQATRVLSLHPLPEFSANATEEGVDVFLCRQKLAIQPALAGIKHLNRLEQILASAEWPDERYAEGIMLDMENHVIEGTRSNLFFSFEGKLHTPSLHNCGVAGVFREKLLNILGADCLEGDYTLLDLRQSDEAFVCNGIFGVWPIRELSISQGGPVYYKPGRYCHKASKIFQELLN